MKITKDMTIGEVLQQNINYAEILMSYGMHCLGCPASQAETLEEACQVHGIDVDPVISALNEAF